MLQTPQPEGTRISLFNAMASGAGIATMVVGSVPYARIFAIDDQ